MKTIQLLLGLLLLGFTAHAQETLTGQIKDKENGDPLIGASIRIKGTTQGTVTDTEGNFSLKVNSLPVTLLFSFVGYETQERSISANAPIQVSLPASGEMDEVLIVGSRFTPRTVITSPVPIDNISASELRNSGQTTVDQMLTYKVPSYNATQQTVSDATAHFNPADLRGLGPSRTLVLVNGKRKNPSALVYINDTPGKGEVGVDMKSIPAAAIERVEVLRDGASAQYGSDAIAGVVNIILRDDYEYTDINLFSGVTGEGDGFSIGYDVNTGFKVGSGFLNVSTSFRDASETNRAGKPGKDDLFEVGAGNAWIQQNPDLGMRVGTPNMTSRDIFLNGSIPVGANAEFYSFGGITYRKGISYALYRAPYWVGDPFNIFHTEGTEYQGFQPTFETDIFDHTLAFGVRGEKNEWNYDVSTIFGGNQVDYTIGSTLNVDLGQESPTTFNAGGYEFLNNVTNLDLGRRFFDMLDFSAGTEFRTERFVATAGEEASYVGGGAQSFPGLQPGNEVDKVRYNVGIYVDLGLDITEDLFIGGAARFEDYSDFGDNFTWKANARYKLAEDKLSIRASVSTGFRAPSLHQIYLSNIQTLVSGGTVSNQGTFNNQSPVIRALEVDKLKEEDAVNFTAGIAARPLEGFQVSVDYYQIQVDDRIVYSSSVATTDTTTVVGQILNEYNVTSMKFFINAVNTISQGVDFVASYNDIELGTGNLGVSLAFNYNETRIDGQISTPAPIQAANFDIFDRKEQSRILTARPNTKVILGLNYEIAGFSANLNNTLFGEVTWKHGTDPDKDQTFSPRVVTDLNLQYRFNTSFAVSVGANNLLNVYPDVIDSKGDVATDLGGRFKYPWEVNQFGFNGTVFQGKVNIRF